MTELIVALDGPNPASMMQLLSKNGVSWVKIGPQSIIYSAASLIDLAVNIRTIMRALDMAGDGLDFNLFLDLKLADTKDTVREAVKRFAASGVAAVSTFTEEATEAAVEGAEGSPLKVWQVARLTDQPRPIVKSVPKIVGHGIICPVDSLHYYKQFNFLDRITPGVRLLGHEGHGHINPASPHMAKGMGATHAVVGRPIWSAEDPIEVLKLYQEALK